MRVAVAGAGAWGTALAALMASDEEAVVLWAREPEVAADINVDHENKRFLPGVRLPAALAATNDLALLASADAILLAVPAQHLRAVASPLAKSIGAAKTIVICAKGIEQGTGLLMSKVLAEACAQAVPAVLSGPSFAAEVAAGKPTAVTLAIADRRQGERLAAPSGGRPSGPI